MTTWFLDVDGLTVNRRPRHPAVDGWTFRRYEVEIPGVLTEPLVVCAADEVLNFVTQVVESGAAQCLWLSSWRMAAPLHLGPALGLPQFGTVPLPPGEETMTERPIGDGSNWVQEQAVRHAIRHPEHKFVWSSSGFTTPVVRRLRNDFEGQGLVVPCEPDTGLTRAQLHRIAEFLGGTYG